MKFGPLFCRSPLLTPVSGNGPREGGRNLFILGSLGCLLARLPCGGLELCLCGLCVGQDDELLALELHLRQLLHHDLHGRVRGEHDQSEALQPSFLHAGLVGREARRDLGLSIAAVLVELDVEEVGDAGAVDEVGQVVVRRPPRHVPDVAKVAPALVLLVVDGPIDACRSLPSLLHPGAVEKASEPRVAVTTVALSPLSEESAFTELFSVSAASNRSSQPSVLISASTSHLISLSRRIVWRRKLELP